MTDRTDMTRRTALKTLGGAAAAGLGVAATGPTAAASPWSVAETPIDSDVTDVIDTATGVYATAGGGVIIARNDGTWEKVLDGGVGGNGNDLRGASVTDDGERLWVVGSSGAIGEYDVRTGSLNDFSAPNDVTNNFNGVSVTGTEGEANVYVAGDSGKIYYSFDNGETFGQVTPGSGSEVNGIDFFDERSGHAVDGNQTAFVTDDGSSYDKVGIPNANVNLYGVDTDGDDDVWVAGGGGTVFNYDGAQWVSYDTGDANLQDIEVAVDDTAGLTVGGGGKVFQFDGVEWVQQSTPTGQNLNAVVRGDPDIAVGAAGTVIER